MHERMQGCREVRNTPSSHQFRITVCTTIAECGPHAFRHHDCEPQKARQLTHLPQRGRLFQPRHCSAGCTAQAPSRWAAHRGWSSQKWSCRSRCNWRRWSGRWWWWFPGKWYSTSQRFWESTWWASSRGSRCSWSAPLSPLGPLHSEDLLWSDNWIQKLEGNQFFRAVKWIIWHKSMTSFNLFDRCHALSVHLKAQPLYLIDPEAKDQDCW